MSATRPASWAAFASAQPMPPRPLLTSTRPDRSFELSFLRATFSSTICTHVSALTLTIHMPRTAIACVCELCKTLVLVRLRLFYCTSTTAKSEAVCIRGRDARAPAGRRTRSCPQCRVRCSRRPSRSAFRRARATTSSAPPVHDKRRDNWSSG